jgi:hypothetical protein
MVRSCDVAIVWRHRRACAGESLAVQSMFVTVFEQDTEREIGVGIARLNDPAPERLGVAGCGCQRARPSSCARGVRQPIGPIRSESGTECEVGLPYLTCTEPPFSAFLRSVPSDRVELVERSSALPTSARACGCTSRVGRTSSLESWSASTVCTHRATVRVRRCPPRQSGADGLRGVIRWSGRRTATPCHCISGADRRPTLCSTG